MAEKTQKRNLAECPRCGYDLRGEVASWKSSCPRHGVCSECGLAINWGGLLTAGFNPPRWHVEHSSCASIWGVALRAPGHAIRGLRPQKYWRELPIESTKHVWRSVQVAVIGLLLAILVFGAIEYGLRFAADAALGGGTLLRTTSGLYGVDWIVSDALTVLMPSVLGDVYFVWWGAPLDYTVEVDWNVQFSFPIALVLSPCLLYFVMPFTLRKARIRAVHTVRVSAYYLVSAVILIESYSLAVYFLEKVQDRYDLSSDIMLAVLLALLVAALCWMWTWWVAVNREYLRIDRPRVVTGAMLVIAVLVAMISPFLFHELLYSEY